MAKSAAGAGKAKQPVESVPENEPANPLKPSECREYMRRELAEAFTGIVAGFVKEATTGSCAHVKLASELLEKTPAKKVPRRKGSAERALEALQRM